MHDIKPKHFINHMVNSIIANFPWLEPLVIKAIRSSKAGGALRVINRIAVGLIKQRIQSQQPPKVCNCGNYTAISM